MSPKKPGYTLEQHEKLGIELQNMRDRLGEITSELSQAYPFKLSDIAKKAKLEIDMLRGKLESIVCQENPAIKDAFKIYKRNIGTMPE